MVKKKLLDLLVDWVKHYSKVVEDTYKYWCKNYKDMGKYDIEEYLAYLANKQYDNDSKFLKYRIVPFVKELNKDIINSPLDFA